MIGPVSLNPSKYKFFNNVFEEFCTFSDIYIELLRGYHDLDSTVHIHHTDSHIVTIRAYNGQEVHVVRVKYIFYFRVFPASDIF